MIKPIEYYEGYRSFWAGENHLQNPYSIFTESWRNWDDGWTTAHEQREKATQGLLTVGRG